MITKGKGRGRVRQLSAHLLRSDENENVRLHESRGTIAMDVEGALIEMAARAAAVNTARPLYHASISPDARTPLTNAQIAIAVDTLEEKLGLGCQPRVVVVHRKKGREHVHVVWSRIDLERARVITDAWNYRAHEEAARELEARFGHEAVQGSLVRHQGNPSRRGRAATDHEFRQEERSGRSGTTVAAELTALWHGADDAEAFRRDLAQAGYILARGDRRVFVVIDRNGEVHSLARRITGATSRDIRTRLSSIGLSASPSVAEARERVPRGDAASAARSPKPLFRAAACEVAMRGCAASRQAPATLRTIVEAQATLRATTNLGPEGPTSTRVRLAAVCGSARPASHYRAQRAILIASFAAKISATIRDARRDELDAILNALLSERDHALRTLTQEHGKTWQPRRRRKRWREDGTQKYFRRGSLRAELAGKARGGTS